jgi:hypothetical protein
MSHIDPTLIAVIVAVVLSIFVIRFLFRPRRPPTVNFKCVRCGIIAHVLVLACIPFGLIAIAVYA